MKVTILLIALSLMCAMIIALLGVVYRRRHVGAARPLLVAQFIRMQRATPVRRRSRGRGLLFWRRRRAPRSLRQQQAEQGIPFARIPREGASR